ncbi:unnamed protein product [Fusarium venenatum]|uniref:Uncharacterized protein n=1 Tax=Fusarium venenatum TaxID=56646 RepID=A0A2L2T9B4_9HYPO|nr:uncharacterized protein FVRRES_04024 [Fusarium venenatum]CEI67512.1 unnamed protein product [Fusarium venenatum]
MQMMVCLGSIDAIPRLVDWSVGGVDVSGGTLQTFQQPARKGIGEAEGWDRGGEIDKSSTKQEVLTCFCLS